MTPTLVAVQPPVPVPSVLDNPHKKFALASGDEIRANRSMRVLKGYLYQEMSEIIGCSIVTVCPYVQAYHRGGLEELEPDIRPDAPSV